MAGTMILGIDPGLSGGLAIMSKTGVLVEPMPTIDKELDLVELSRLIGGYANDIRCAFIEDVHAMPKQGVSSMFKFGKVYGMAQGIVAANKIPMTLVTPQKWMKVIHGNIVAQDSKDRSRLAFNRLFPKVNVVEEGCRVQHMGMLEATLIAEYGRRFLLGGLC